MRPPRQGRGFTLVELITIMILIGILAVVALPKLNSAQDFGALAFRDRVATSLRYAQKSAVAKRRMVCATVTAGALTLTVADTFGGACNTPMSGPDGADPAAVSPSAAVVLDPASTLYFQPSGAVTSNAAGTAPVTTTITVTGQTSITARGTTGYVD
jgi:MSHA pilin protein MshC